MRLARSEVSSTPTQSPGTSALTLIRVRSLRFGDPVSYGVRLGIVGSRIEGLCQVAEHEHFPNTRYPDPQHLKTRNSLTLTSRVQLGT